MIWGIDLGGTKIECVVLETPDPNAVRIRKRIDTEAQHGYEHIVSRIKLLVDMVADEIGVAPERLGIGTPGTTDPGTGLLKNSNTTCLNHQPLLASLEDVMDIPIIMANDANCFALAEARMGIVPEKYPDAKVVFGVIMGTGVGGGVIVNGQPIGGRHGIGGEWGHNFLDESGGTCYCGKVGCVERIISGTGLQRFYQSRSGNFKKLKEIMQLADLGMDPDATATANRLVEFFGKAIAVVINILDPDVIVLGGGVGNVDILYTRGVENVLKHVFNPVLNTPFLKPKLGDSAGVFGAALLVAND